MERISGEEHNVNNMDAVESDGNTSFLRAARNGQLEKVLEHLKSSIDINTSNANGLNALHLASKDGHVEIVEELLKRGAAVNAATKKGNTALHIASLAGQENVVKLLVQHGASVNVQSQNGFTPLYMAAQENHDNVVKYLLANGANQSLSTEDGFTPLAVAMQQGHDKVVTVLLENDTRGKVRLPALHIAAKKDDVKAAKLLLENDHNPDVTSKSGFTPLHIASHYGNGSIADLLVQKGADVNYSAKHNITPLHVAAKWGKSNMVALLLEQGAHIESKTRDGLTPLHCAARSGHEQVVSMLLESAAPISSKTKNGLAPLHMAAQGDHVDAARILLYHRAPVDEVTVDYLTALHVAAHCGHVRVAKLLLDRQADANARALNGFTPLHIACKKNRIKVVELLLEHGASIGATTESGLTPLHVASFMGCMNIVIYLLRHDASPDAPTVRGETPLHLAARANQTDIIRILLRNGAQVDARAREQQTPLHIASRLGNVDIVMLLLQHGAKVDNTTKDMYTALHIAAKEGQDEVAAVLIDNGASLNATTKKGFTPLHLAAKYGHLKVAKLLVQKEAPVDAQGKNGVTPLHVASHYDHQNVALLLLDKGASPHANAKNGHTPLHIAARKNQMDIANTLLEYGAQPNAESKAGFTPLHLSSQEGHTEISSLLLEHKANPSYQAKNGLTPLHLCAQEDRVPVAEVLVKNGADIDNATKGGYTPLHIACHYGQANMVRFLISNGANVKSTTSIGYTPLHQAAQQGHASIVNILLEHSAQPNAITMNGQTPLHIAQKLGYISVIDTLKQVTESTPVSTTTEEKYRVVAPEAMHETFLSDSEEEGEDTLLGDQTYRYLTADEMKSLGDDSLPIDVTRDERIDSNKMVTSDDPNMYPPQHIEDTISPEHIHENYVEYIKKYTPDIVDIARHPITIGFLVSFLVDARGGAMRGCRHSGVRVIVPQRCAPSPTRITCRYVRPQRTPHPPPLMEGEALASRVLELGPVGAKFLGPVIIEVPHFAALRGKEREIVILRSDNGESWKEHTLEATEDILNEVLRESFDAEDLNQMEDISSGRITRIITQDFPQYFAVVSRIRQEVHVIGPEGGMVSSTVVPQVQAVFPQGALTKKIKVGLQAQPINPELTAKLLGHGVAVSPVVTVEPRRRKFHKAITLSMPAPRAHSQGMINQYSGSAPTLRLLCSITGGTSRAQWEDVTGSTPLTFVNDCVSFTTTVSARFWLMDCRNIGDATKMATELYREAIHVPFMAKFVVFAKKVDPLEARLRVFCMTDDKEDKTLEYQEQFSEVAKSRDVEVLEGKSQYIEFAGNLVPITKSGEQLEFSFRAFKENRLPFSVRVKDQHAEAVSRCLFMREPKVQKGEPPQQPICILNIVLPDDIVSETISLTDSDPIKKRHLTDNFDYYRQDPRLADISNLLGDDWVALANQLGLTSSEINVIKSEYPDSVAKQAQSMLRMWLSQSGNKTQSNTLENGLRRIGREDIVHQCLSISERAPPVIKHSSEEIGGYRLKRETLENDSNIQSKMYQENEESGSKNIDTFDKYSAEEKVFEPSDEEEDFNRSVPERREQIEKRLSVERTIPASSQRVEIVQEISSIKRQSLVEDKIAEVQQKGTTTEPVKLIATKAIKKETPDKKSISETEVKTTISSTTAVPEVDLETENYKNSIKTTQAHIFVPDSHETTHIRDVSDRRDSDLLEEVTHRLETKKPVIAIVAGEDPKSPKFSKTPPPSPADFALQQQQATTIQEWGATRKFGDLDSAAKQPEILEAEPLGKTSPTTQYVANLEERLLDKPVDDLYTGFANAENSSVVNFKSILDQTNKFIQSESQAEPRNSQKVDPVDNNLQISDKQKDTKLLNKEDKRDKKGFFGTLKTFVSKSVEYSDSESEKSSPKKEKKTKKKKVKGEETKPPILKTSPQKKPRLPTPPQIRKEHVIIATSDDSLSCKPLSVIPNETEETQRTLKSEIIDPGEGTVKIEEQAQVMIEDIINQSEKAANEIEKPKTPTRRVVIIEEVIKSYKPASIEDELFSITVDPSNRSPPETIQETIVINLDEDIALQDKGTLGKSPILSEEKIMKPSVDLTAPIRPPNLKDHVYEDIEEPTPGSLSEPSIISDEDVKSRINNLIQNEINFRGWADDKYNVCNQSISIKNNEEKSDDKITDSQKMRRKQGKIFGIFSKTSKESEESDDNSRNDVVEKQDKEIIKESEEGKKTGFFGLFTKKLKKLESDGSERINDTSPIRQMQQPNKIVINAFDSEHFLKTEKINYQDVDAQVVGAVKQENSIGRDIDATSHVSTLDEKKTGIFGIFKKSKKLEISPDTSNIVQIDIGKPIREPLVESQIAEVDMDIPNKNKKHQDQNDSLSILSEAQGTYIKFSDDELTYRDIPETISGVDEEKPKMITKTVTFKEQETQESESEIPLKVKIVQLSDELREYPLSLVNIRSTNSFLKNEIECFHDVRPLIIEIVDESSVDTDLKNQIHPNYTEITIPKEDDSASSSIGVKSKGIKGFFGKRAKSKDRDKPDSQEMRSIRTDNNEKDIPNEGEDANGLKESESYLNSNMISLKDGTVLSDKESIIEERPVMTENVEKDIEESLSDRNEPKANSKDVKSKGFLSLFGKRSKSQERDKQDQRKIKSNRKGDSKEQKQTAVSDNVVKEMNSSRNFLETEISFYHDAISSVVSPSSKQTGCLPSATRIISTETETDAEKNTISSFSKKEVKNVEMKHMFENRNESQERDKSEKRSTETCQTDNIIHQMQNITVTDRGHHYIEGSGKLEMNEAQLYIDKGLTTMKAEPISTTGDTKSKSFMGLFGKKAKSQERGKPELQQSTPATVDDSIIDTTIITSDKITQGTDDSKIFLDQEVQIYHDVKLFPERDQESKDMSLNEDVLLIQSPNVDIIRVKNQTVSSSVCSKPEDTTNRGMSNLFDKISKSQEREELEEKKSIQEVGSAIDQHCRDAFVHSDNEPSKLHQNVANSSERGVKLHYEVKEGKTVPESDIINHIEPIPSDGSFVPTGMVETGAAAAPSDKVILGTCHEHAKRKGMMSFFGKRPKSQERDKSEQYETKLTDTGVNFDLGSEDTIARDTQLNTDSFLKKEIEFYHNAKFETDEIKISEKMEPSQEDQMLSISTDIDNEKTQKKSTKKLKSVSRSKEVIAKGLINLFGKKANSQDREIPELAEPEKRDRTVLDEGMSLCESVNIDHSEVFPKEKLGVHHESEILIKDNVVLESSSTTIDETKIGKLSDKQKPVVSNVEMKGKGLMRLFGKMPKSQEHERADLQELKSTTDHENLTDLQEMIISPDKIPKYLNNSANFLKIEMELYEDNQSVHIYKLPILEVPSTNIVMDKRVSAKVVSETKTVKGKGILGLFSKRGKSQERDISKQEPKSTSTDSHVDNICQPITLPGNVLHIQKETEDFLKIEVQQYDDVKVVDMERIGKPVSEKETRSVDLTTVAGQVTEVETGIILDKRRVPAKLSDDGVRASQYIGDTSHFLNEEILKRPSEPKTVMEKSKQDEKKSEAVQIRIKNELEKGETTKISKSRGIIGLFSKSDSLKETSERNESLGNEVVGTDGATVNVETSVNQHLQYNHTHEALIRNIESCNNFLNHEVTLHHDKNIFSNKVVTKRSKGKTILEFFGKRPKSEDRDRTNVLTEKCNTLPRSVSVSPRKQTQTIPTPSGPLSCTVMADIDASGSFFGKENDISSNSKLLPEKTDHQYRSIVETLEKSPKSEEFQSGKTREKDEGIMATNGNNSETFNIPKTVYVPNATESKPSTFDVIDESRNFLKFETDFYYDFGIVSADSDINILNDQKEKKGKGLIGLFGSRNKSQNRAKKDTVLTSEGNKNEKVSNEAVNDVTDRKTSKGFLSLFTKRGKTHDKENYPKEDSLPMEYSIQFDEADSNKRTILQNRLSSTHNTDAILDGIQVEGSIDNGNNNAELSEPILQETSCTYNLDGSEYISDYVGHLIDNRIIQEHEVETSSVDGLYSARSSEFKVDEKYSPETNSDDAFTFIKEEVEKFESTKLASTDLLDSSFRVDTTVEKVVEDGIDKDIIIKKITITEKLIEKRPRSEKDIIIPSVVKDSAELIPKSNEESKSVDKVFEQMEYTNRFISNEVDNYQDVRPIVKQEVITVPKDEKKGSSIFVLFGKKKSQDHDENRTDRNSRFTAGEEKSATKGRSKSSSPFRIFTKKQSRSGEKSEKLQLSEDTLKTLSETTSFLNTEINCYNDVKITSEPTDSGSIISAIYVPSECIEGMTHSFNLTQSMATPSHIPVTEAERPIEEGVGKSHGILSIFGKKSKEDSSDFAVKKVKKHHKQLSIEQTEEMHIEEATEGINIVESAQCDLVEDVSNLEAKEIGFGIIKPKVKITDLDENFPSTPEVPKSNLNIESEQKSKKGFFAKISEKLTGKSNELQGKVVNIDSPIEDKIKTQTLEITADTPYVSKEENGSNIRSSNIELKTSDFFTEMLDKFDSKLEDVKVSVQNVSVSDTADHFTGRNVKSIAQIPVDIENDMTTVIPEGYNAMITEYQTNEDMEQDSKIPTTSTTEITKLMMPSYSGDLDVVQSLSNQEHREKMIVSVDEHLGEMLKTGTNVIRANEGELEDQRIHLIKVAKLETQSEIPTVRPTIVCKETYVGTQGTDIIDRSASEVIDICDPTIDTSVILIGEPTKTSGHTISEIKTDDHKLNGTRKTEEIKPLNIEEHDQYSASKDQNNVDMASKKPKSFFSKLGKKLGGKKDKVTEDKQCKVKRTVLPESYIGEPTKSAEVIGTFGKNLREAEAAKDTKPIGIETTGHADVIDIANQVPNIIQVTEEFVENLKVHYIPETQHYVSNKFLDSHVKSNVYNTMTRTVSDIGGNLEKIDDDKGHKISETNIDLSTLPSDLDEFVPKRGKLTATKSDSSSYVTSPTMEIGTTSKRYTEIPVVKEISQFSLDDSDEESQMVAEPNIPSLKIHKSELVEESEDDSGTKRKPLFRLESEEDDAHDNLKLIERRLSSSSNVLETLTDNKLEILLTDLDIQLGENLTKATIVTDQVTKSNTSDDSTDADREQANEKKGIESDVDLIEQKLRDIDRALDGLEEIDKLMNKDDSDKKETKLRRVERKFERMASEAMDKEIQNGKEEKLSTPELEVIGNKEFQQLVSQMSHEEVRDSEQEYTNLWDEYTYSKSDDWNSKTPDSQADVLELPQGDEASSISTPRDSSSLRGATDDVTTGQVSAERTSQPRIPADQHQLSDEMKQLLEEMEKESKHQ